MATDTSDASAPDKALGLRVLLVLIAADPRLAIQYAQTLPPYADLVGFVANYNPDYADRMAEILRVPMEEVMESL